LPVAKQNAISAGTSPSEDNSETMPAYCRCEPVQGRHFRPERYSIASLWN
jgi:hypothetical protein